MSASIDHAQSKMDIILSLARMIADLCVTSNLNAEAMECSLDIARHLVRATEVRR